MRKTVCTAQYALYFALAFGSSILLSSRRTILCCIVCVISVVCSRVLLYSIRYDLNSNFSVPEIH